MRIKRATKSSLGEILPLIEKYQRFYRVSPSASRNKLFFRGIIGRRDRGALFLATDADGAAVGFATLYFIPSSLSARTACVLNDLYTLPAHRGKGVAQALLNHCREYARRRGFRAIEWQTAASNKRAQRLYDKTSALMTRWRHYRLALG